VIKNTDAVPGVTGATWNSAASSSFFSAPVIDNNGNVAFRGQMTSGVGGVVTNPSNQAGYWYGAPGSLNLFARDGSSGPTLPNSYNWVHNTAANGAGLAASSPPIAPDGTVLVGSTMNGTGAGNGTNTFAWTGAHNGMQAIGQQGVTSPSGPTHALWSSTLATLPLAGAWVNNAGQTMIASNLAADTSGLSDIVAGNTTTSNDSGIWVASPSGNTMLARENGLTPIGGGTQFGELGTVGGTSALNGSGQVAVVTTLRAGVGGVVSSGTRNDSVLWTNSVPGAQLTAVARKNDPVPGLAGVNYYSGNAIAFFLGQQPLNNSGRLVFDAQFGTGWASGGSNEAIMTSLNGNTNVVVRQGNPAAGVPGATWDLFNTTNAKIRLNNNANLVFTAQMLGTGGTSNDEGIWFTHLDSNGNATNTQLMAQEGQAIPSFPGLNLGGGLVASSGPILNNLDQVVFLGTLTGSGVTGNTNDQALFAWTPADGLQMLLREGDESSNFVTGLSGTIGNNTTPTITPFSYATGGNGEGGSMALSDTGWLTLSVQLNGTNNINIIRTQIPEPTMLGGAGAGAALALMTRRARKGRRRA
jgi:hypothetical protein